jgi:hypothetical protein
MRLSVARLCRPETKLIYPNHPPRQSSTSLLGPTKTPALAIARMMLGIVAGNVDSPASELEAAHNLVRRHHFKYTVGLASTCQYPN